MASTIGKCAATRATLSGGALNHRALQERARAHDGNCCALEIEDYVIQTAEFMSPRAGTLVHLLVFRNAAANVQIRLSAYSQEFLFYFNSILRRVWRAYRKTEARHEIAADSERYVAYRNHIDEQMLRFLETVETHRDATTILSLVRLGLEHEMQHRNAGL